MTNRSLQICFYFLISCFASLQAQTKALYGHIQNEEEVEGIHVLNTRSHLNTITNADGAFRMNVEVGDTLIISSIKYMPEQIAVTPAIYETGRLSVVLEPLVNELNEVLLFPKLSGDLARDIKRIPVVDSLNFDDVGIPGFKGKPQEKIPNLIGQVITPTSVDFEGLYKHLSGYYKTLRTKRKWEAQNQVAVQVMHHYTPSFFTEVYGIPENRLYDFVLFCVETSTIQDDFLLQKHGKVHDIFATKSKIYLERLTSSKEE